MTCNCHSHNGFLTEAGLEKARLAQQLSLEGLAPLGVSEYIDSRVSVSGLRRDEDMFALVSDTTIDEQARRFHGSSF